MKNNGICQTLQTIPTSNVLLKGDMILVNFGSINPRHLTSSNQPMTINKGIFNNMYVIGTTCSPSTLTYGRKDDTRIIATIDIPTELFER